VKKINIATSSIYFPYKNKVSLEPLQEFVLNGFMSNRNDFSTWQNLGDLWPITSFNQNNWFESVSNDKNKLYFVLRCLESNKSLGMVRVNPIDWINRSACVGVDILKPLRNQGYGTLAMKCVLKYCFDYLNLNRCWLFVLDSNEPAKYVYKKVGFKKEGVQKQAIFRNGEYVDYVMMSMLKKDFKRMKNNGKI